MSWFLMTQLGIGVRNGNVVLPAPTPTTWTRGTMAPLKFADVGISPIPKDYWNQPTIAPSLPSQRTLPLGNTTQGQGASTWYPVSPYKATWPTELPDPNYPYPQPPPYATPNYPDPTPPPSPPPGTPPPGGTNPSGAPPSTDPFSLMMPMFMMMMMWNMIGNMPKGKKKKKNDDDDFEEYEEY